VVPDCQQARWLAALLSAINRRARIATGRAGWPTSVQVLLDVHGAILRQSRSRAWWLRGAGVIVVGDLRTPARCRHAAQAMARRAAL